MNIVELRQMMIAFKGSIWFKLRGIEFCVSYDKSDLHGIPYVLAKGSKNKGFKVLCSGNAVINARSFSILDHMFTVTELKQVKYLLSPVSMYEPVIDEEIRFLEQGLTERAKFTL